MALGDDPQPTPAFADADAQAQAAQQAQLAFDTGRQRMAFVRAVLGERARRDTGARASSIAPVIV